MATHHDDAGRFVARKYVRDRLHEATGARVDPELVDRIVDDLHGRLDDHVQRLAAAHSREKELRVYHAVQDYCPMLRPHHLEDA